MNTFDAVTPTEEQLKQITIIRCKFYEMECELNALLPAGRLKSLALTSLEESALWANKAVSRG